jgi:hypothetical protein
MKLRLIPDWKQAYKFLSIQFSVLLGVLSLAYVYLPEIRTYLPETWSAWISLAIIIGRVIDQQVKEGNRAQ